MASILVTGTKSVTAADTPEQLTTTSTVVEWVTFQAHPDTTTVAVVGDGNIDPTQDGTARGTHLYPKEAGAVPNSVTFFGPLDLSEIYVDAGNNGDGVMYTAKLYTG